jgi:hypothetical protein
VCHERLTLSAPRWCAICAHAFCWLLQIGVITPYEGQRAHVVAAMLRSGTLRQEVYKEVEVGEPAPRLLRRTLPAAGWGV